MVAKVGGKYFSIFDANIEYVLGQTMFQQVQHEHGGGFYVYPTLKQAILADVPYNENGLYTAPRTILVCMCWGDSIDYSNGKIAFSYICPVKEFPLEKGYLATKAARREIEEQTMSSTKGFNKSVTYNKIKDQLFVSKGPESVIQKKRTFEKKKTHDLIRDENAQLEREILEMEEKLRAIQLTK